VALLKIEENMDRNYINITIYDLEDYLDDGYEEILVYKSSTPDGTYIETTTSATRITLETGTTYYHYLDEASGIASYSYKIKLGNVSGTKYTDFLTPAFYANTSDMVETLRYSIEDIDTTQRYTDKELRRFIKIGINKLQLTNYIKRFQVDFTGIISPRPNNQDQAIILIQAMIEVNKSQITKAADTYMSFNDGRGRIDVKTSLALKDNIKELQLERDSLIKAVTKRNLYPYLVDMSNLSPYYAYYTC
jgi:hypothetical protein